MGQVGRVLVTGASGYIGRATVDAALAAGMEVVAVQRRPGPDGSAVSYVPADLTLPDAVPALTDALSGCDAVIHLAAAMSGDAEAHRRLTIGGTRHLLEAMQRAGVPHLTLASSLAVFDTSHVPMDGVLTDECPLENPSAPRDAYSGAKVQQEMLARAAKLSSLAILRPGIVYDAEHLWNAHLGIAAGPALFRFGWNDLLPMTHVTLCAGALVQATLLRVTGTMTVLDPVLPKRGEVIDTLRKSGWPKIVVPLPWQVLWGLASIFQPLSARLPGLLRKNVLRQRGMPMEIQTRPPGFAAQLPGPAPAWGGTA